MKVLSYLELVNLCKDDNEIKLQREQYETLWVRFGSHVGSFHTSMFYSQPFKPELITELFEGWKMEVWNSQECYINDSLQLQIELDENQKNNKDCQYYYINFKGDVIYLSANVRTLDDFINDASRAGIELTWRKTE